MRPNARARSWRPHSVTPSDAPIDPPPAATQATFGRAFWMAWAANFTLVAAISLLARYADFVRFYQSQHSEWWLGWIVGVGMIGSIVVRLAQGQAIDRMGPGRIWVACGLLATLSLLGHLWVTAVDGPMVFLLRVGLYSGAAGMFGACTAFIALRADEGRLAEMVGTLGTSGFVGMMLGPVLGDLIFATSAISVVHIQMMFLMAAGLVLLATMFGWLATQGTPRPRAAIHRAMPLAWLLRRYFPGSILLVGLMQGIVLVIPQVFLAEYVYHLKLTSISSFFLTYATVALVTRILIRSFAARYGIPAMALIGRCSAARCCVLMIPVAAAWQLVPPAFFLGVAHAFLFPAHVAGGSAAFPDRHRGVATSLMLMTMDVGILIGGPLLGVTIFASRLAGWPPFASAYVLLAAMCLGVATVYGLTAHWRLARPKRALPVTLGWPHPELAPTRSEPLR